MITSLTRSAALAVAVLALSACSGGSGTTAALSSTAPTASETSAPAPSASASSTGAAGSPDQVVEQFCADRAELTALGTQIEAGGVPAAVQQLPAFSQRMDSMQPPEAIASDFAEYRAAWASVAQAVQGASPDDPTLQGKVQAAIAAHPDAQAVEDRLKTWTDANCPSATASPSAG